MTSDGTPAGPIVRAIVRGSGSSRAQIVRRLPQSSGNRPVHAPRDESSVRGGGSLKTPPGRFAGADPFGGRSMNATRIRWVAFTAAGEAHAVPSRGRWVWTACRLPAVDERMTWPERTRCPRCLAALGFLA